MKQKQEQMRVRWEIDVYASTPRQAAVKARAAVRRKNTTATVYDVDTPDGTRRRIDLSTGEESVLVPTLSTEMKLLLRVMAVLDRTFLTDNLPSGLQRDIEKWLGAVI